MFVWLGALDNFMYIAMEGIIVDVYSLADVSMVENH